MKRAYYILRNDARVLAIHQIRDSAQAVMERYINATSCCMSLELLEVVVDQQGVAVSETVRQMYSPLTGVMVDLSGGELVPIRTPLSRKSTSSHTGMVEKG